MKSHELIDSIVYNCSTYESNGRRIIDWSKVDENDLLELCSAFMKESGRNAYEALIENNYLDTDILPAVFSILENPGNKEAAYNLRETIQKSILSYYTKTITEMVEEACEVFNRDEIGSSKFREVHIVDGRAYSVAA